MSFVFANKTRNLPPEPVDWRQLYIKAKEMLRKPRTYPGFQNRSRIWTALEHVIPVLTLRLANEKQLAKAPYSGRNPRPDGFVSRGVAAGDLTYESGSSMLRNNSATTELDAGSRLFEKHNLAWFKAPTTGVTRLGVSFLHHGQRTYICGLRLLSEKNCLDEVEYDRAGFIDTLNEQVIQLNMDDVMESICLNLVMEGIIGLRIDMKGSNGPYSRSVGNMDVINFESGFAKLIPQGISESPRHFSLLVGIDVSQKHSIVAFVL
jgi:hypothetical protein